MKFTTSAALLDACVLGILAKAPAYGYSLTQNLQIVINVSESTLYPVLRRLLKYSMVDTFDETFNGRNRRYYKITPEGTKALKEYITEWYLYRDNIEKLLIMKEETTDE